MGKAAVVADEVVSICGQAAAVVVASAFDAFWRALGVAAGRLVVREQETKAEPTDDATVVGIEGVAPVSAARELARQRTIIVWRAARGLVAAVAADLARLARDGAGLERAEGRLEVEIAALRAAIEVRFAFFRDQLAREVAAVPTVALAVTAIVGAVARRSVRRTTAPAFDTSTLGYPLRVAATGGVVAARAAG